MKFNNLQVEINERIAVVTLNHAPVNALNSEVLKELEVVMNELDKNEDVDVLILTGAGKAFVAGADISEMVIMSAQEGKDFGAYGSKVFRQIETMSKPVIAAVNGFALGGGCELALACDIRLASEKAKFGQPEVALGITPGFAGTQRLPRIVGRGRAKEMILTGDMIDAVEADRIGLVNKVVEAELLMEAAEEFAKRIIKNGQVAVRFAKAAMNEGVDLDFESANNIEKLYFGMCFSTQDQKEGMKAFLDRRKADFKNK
ncbi:hypothetical protein EZV73_12960 [Acidaminobacter sp. JC074]|uniref:enoyl-CoA hydratase-related protein n=1 Tax=Acidaminobacter sp. JC074 TaxID=2530199 RepID=UPI001F107372|nr:enoyl-CoA hydratase-related protein [Acidaminobacter sp. JC074]MCH4888495.1 hypothetical protein [Acidaminobacter sp. JC074]